MSLIIRCFSKYQELLAIGTKFAPPYACIYMDRVKQDFLETQELKPLLWLRFIDNIFFFGLMSWKGRIKKVYGEI